MKKVENPTQKAEIKKVNEHIYTDEDWYSQWEEAERQNSTYYAQFGYSPAGLRYTKAEYDAKIEAHFQAHPEDRPGYIFPAPPSFLSILWEATIDAVNFRLHTSNPDWEEDMR